MIAGVKDLAVISWIPMALFSEPSPRLSGVSLVDQTSDRLRQAIFQGSFPPGAHLREMRIAKDYGVSQSTVREALQRLESAGLVTRSPHIGTTVTRLSPREVRERVALRTLLEVKAAEEAAIQMGEAEFIELEARLAALAEPIMRDAYYEAAQADLDFHRYIWECSGNETLCALLGQITVPLMAFVSVLRATGVQRLAITTDSHEPLVNALRSKDRAKIAEAFARGASSSYADFMDVTPMSQRARAFGMLEDAPPL